MQCSPGSRQSAHHLVGAGTINNSDFSVVGLVVSLVGAIILLALFNLTRRKTVG